MNIFRSDIPNNNRQAVKILARANLKENRGRNIILTGTIALCILVLCTVFGIALGKVDAQYLQSVRSTGSVATTYLERGSMDQYNTIRSLSYIQEVGREKQAGYFYDGETFVATVKCLDETGWEKLTRPAYTHIHGQYPTELGEVMLSMRALENLGITHPQLGMEIPMTMQFGIADQREVTFTLCGWFRDYTPPEVIPPPGYVSASQLDAWGMSLNEADQLLILQKNSIDGYQIEEKLYKDVKMLDKSQQFFGGNTYLYSIMNEFVGGYKMAAFGAVLVLVSVYLLIYNILSMSIQKEIRQIGLLDTLGTTRRQIISIYLRQTSVLLFWGCLIGVILSLCMVLFVVPCALGNLYLYNFGRSADLHVFRPGLFVASILFTICVVLLAVAMVIRKATHLSPLEAMHYFGITSVDMSHCTRKIRKGKRAVQWNLILMSGKNVFRFRKRCAITVFSLFLGITTALGAIVLTKGTDYTNSIEKRPDFSITGNSVDMTCGEAYNDEFAPISEDTKEKLLSVDGVSLKKSEIVRGGYFLVDNTEGLLWTMRLMGKDGGPEIDMVTDALENPEAPVYAETATVQIIEKEYIEKLESYVSENNLNADLESLKNGTGVVALHYHTLSPALQQEADAFIGSPITFWQLRTVQQEEKYLKLLEEDPAAAVKTDFHYRLARQMKVSACLDTQAKGFPKLSNTWFGPGTWYFLSSEEGFKKLQTNEKTFRLLLNVEPKKEPAVKAAVWQIIQKENKNDENLGLTVVSKSDDLAEAQSYIQTNRIILGALSFVLILLGLMNYFNVITTEMLSRRRELSIMESVGMTGKQIRQMLIVEGGIYFVMVTFLVFTVGSGALQLLHVYMDSWIAYFKFVWPGTAVAGILLGLLILCVLIPFVLYRRMEKESLTQRITGI